MYWKLNTNCILTRTFDFEQSEDCVGFMTHIFFIYIFFQVQIE